MHFTNEQTNKNVLLTRSQKSCSKLKCTNNNHDWTRIAFDSPHTVRAYISSRYSTFCDSIERTCPKRYCSIGLKMRFSPRCFQSGQHIILILMILYGTRRLIISSVPLERIVFYWKIQFSYNDTQNCSVKKSSTTRSRGPCWIYRVDV